MPLPYPSPALSLLLDPPEIATEYTGFRISRFITHNNMSPQLFPRLRAGSSYGLTHCSNGSLIPIIGTVITVVWRHSSPSWQPQLWSICKVQVPISGSLGRQRCTSLGQQKFGKQAISDGHGAKGRNRFILAAAACVSSSILTVSSSTFMSLGIHCLTGMTFPRMTSFLVSTQVSPAWQPRFSLSGLLQASSFPRFWPKASFREKIRVKGIIKVSSILF